MKHITHFPFLALVMDSWICLPNVSLESSVKPRYLCLGNCLTMMSLKIFGRWAGLFLLQDNITSTACLLTSGLNCIFHWKTHCLIRLRPLFKTVAKVSSPYTTVRREASSAKSLASELMLSTRSLVYAKKNNGLKTLQTQHGSGELLQSVESSGWNPDWLERVIHYHIITQVVTDFIK